MSSDKKAPDSTMRYPQGDLAILSAEIYTPGVPFPATRSGPRKTPASARPQDDEPRKRARIQEVTENPAQEEEKKRARGRPRLDVKDETAADRRRTQIRLAQRAYRNRKENAIQTLEKRVQELKDANEEMSNVFLQLHDYAVSSGALEANPEFGRQLRLTTEKFLSLARKASEDGNAEDTGAESPKGGSSQPEGTKSSSPERMERDVGKEKSNKTQQILWGGFTVTHEPVTDADLISDFSSNFLPPPTTTGLDFEIITQPTPENASFPFGTAPEFELNTFSAPTLYPSIPLPQTYTSQEATFGRRLQRFANERALILISMPNPPRDRFQRVFGFCLLLETRDAIHRRLQRTVGKTMQENLSNWQYPFYNIGGAGTHFDANQLGMQRVGNQGTLDVLKPQTSAGFGTGPFTSEVADFQASALDKDMRIDMQGFRGDFFDCDEVEVYLRQRGVTIPPGADYVTVEVDPAGLGANSITATTLSSKTDSNTNNNNSGNNQNQNSSNNYFTSNSNTNTGTATTSHSHSPPTSSTETGAASSRTTSSTQQPSSTSTSWPSIGGISSLVDPLLGGVFTSAAGSSGGGSYGTSADHTSFGTDSPSTFAAAPSSTALRPTVMLDVNMLITKMTERATCLGRTPGFRQPDINSAFWKAARVLSG
ncbi:hypothetical protein QBC47DRAFT_33387 [Echria macrotheca]|uniref:BZIP domain-containing protein n=1 Tax=Echria macrotheca TaxID=438768 RepID=A0AAJ0BBJ3_9PEZI|nr:hypothetical protein QBC47DRAFT_33387 [Echria macrotheca]